MQLDKIFFESNNQICYLGEGELGGKAKGLEFINSVIASGINKEDFPDFEINIPKMIVIRTNIFDKFMNNNNLWETALSDIPDTRIALAFQKADLPFNILGDLRMIVTEIKLPLAIRSSSMLEDALHEPFAGIYGTKMTPNNQHSLDLRFRKLVEAIKYVYASTFFKAAKNYIKATKHKTENEKMAVIIQEVVGKKHDDKFYPEISGVARSYNYYPTGGAKPVDGVVNLALGLGKTIVDGGVSWAYTPLFPQKEPPFKSIRDMLYQTQLKFWSVNLGKPSAYDPINETEYMFEDSITEAEKDGTLKKIVSTYDAQADRVWMGQGGDGPRIITFAPILQMSDIPLNDLVKKLMKSCEKALKAPVEIEFAVTLSKNTEKFPHRFGFLQVRPMVVSSVEVNITAEEMNNKNVLISSDKVLGNGIINSIKDIIYIKPEKFNAKYTHKIAKEIEVLNKKLVSENKKYLLIGFGRWGTTDAWAGIPIDWSQISAAKVIVEATMENMIQEMSQASHFFHNVTSFQVLYFSIPFSGKYKINWEKFSDTETIEETEFVKHVRTENSLNIKADGRTGKGMILIRKS